eukprot:Clim_evm32s9 gene=Clim_evmTU32s9
MMKVSNETRAKVLETLSKKFGTNPRMTQLLHEIEENAFRQFPNDSDGYFKACKTEIQKAHEILKQQGGAAFGGVGNNQGAPGGLGGLVTPGARGFGDGPGGFGGAGGPGGPTAFGREAPGGLGGLGLRDAGPSGLGGADSMALLRQQQLQQQARAGLAGAGAPGLDKNLLAQRQAAALGGLGGPGAAGGLGGGNLGLGALGGLDRQTPVAGAGRGGLGGLGGLGNDQVRGAAGAQSGLGGLGGLGGATALGGMGGLGARGPGGLGGPGGPGANFGVAAAMGARQAAPEAKTSQILDDIAARTGMERNVLKEYLLIGTDLLKDPTIGPRLKATLSGVNNTVGIERLVRIGKEELERRNRMGGQGLGGAANRPDLSRLMQQQQQQQANQFGGLGAQDKAKGLAGAPGLSGAAAAADAEQRRSLQDQINRLRSWIQSNVQDPTEAARFVQRLEVLKHPDEVKRFAQNLVQTLRQREAAKELGPGGMGPGGLGGPAAAVAGLQGNAKNMEELRKMQQLQAQRRMQLAQQQAARQQQAGQGVGSPVLGGQDAQSRQMKAQQMLLLEKQKQAALAQQQQAQMAARQQAQHAQAAAVRKASLTGQDPSRMPPGMPGMGGFSAPSPLHMDSPGTVANLSPKQIFARQQQLQMQQQKLMEMRQSQIKLLTEQGSKVSDEMKAQMQQQMTMIQQRQQEIMQQQKVLAATSAAVGGGIEANNGGLGVAGLPDEKKNGRLVNAGLAQPPVKVNAAAIAAEAAATAAQSSPGLAGPSTPHGPGSAGPHASQNKDHVDLTAPGADASAHSAVSPSLAKIGADAAGAPAGAAVAGAGDAAAGHAKAPMTKEYWDKVTHMHGKYLGLINRILAKKSYAHLEQLKRWLLAKPDDKDPATTTLAELQKFETILSKHYAAQSASTPQAAPMVSPAPTSAVPDVLKDQKDPADAFKMLCEYFQDNTQRQDIFSNTVRNALPDTPDMEGTNGVRRMSQNGGNGQKAKKRRLIDGNGTPTETDSPAEEVPSTVENTPEVAERNALRQQVLAEAQGMDSKYEIQARTGPNDGLELYCSPRLQKMGIVQADDGNAELAALLNPHQRPVLVLKIPQNYPQRTPTVEITCDDSQAQIELTHAYTDAAKQVAGQQTVCTILCTFEQILLKHYDMKSQMQLNNEDSLAFLSQFM